MSANGEFNIGRDVSIDIIDPQRGPIRFAIKTGWSATPDYDNPESKGLDGENRSMSIPNGHRLTMNLDRKDSSVEDYFADNEARYFNNELLPNVSVTETIRERNGSISQYRYTDVSLTLGERTWRGNAATTMTVSGRARRKIKIS